MEHELRPEDQIEILHDQGSPNHSLRGFFLLGQTLFLEKRCNTVGGCQGCGARAYSQRQADCLAVSNLGLLVVGGEVVTGDQSTYAAHPHISCAHDLPDVLQTPSHDLPWRPLPRLRVPSRGLPTERCPARGAASPRSKPSTRPRCRAGAQMRRDTVRLGWPEGALSRPYRQREKGQLRPSQP